MNSPSSREDAARDSLLDLLGIEQIAFEVFGEKWRPELLRVPNDLGIQSSDLTGGIC